MKKIIAKEKTLSKSYVDKKMEDIWVKRKIKSSKKPKLKVIKEEEADKKAAVMCLIEEAKEVLLVGSAILGDREITNELKEAAVRGVRLYLLIANTEGSKKELELLAGNAFMRTGINFPGSLLIADPKEAAKGIFLNDSLRSNTFIHQNIVLTLEQAQIAAIYTLFCHWMWNKAERQITTKKDLAKPTVAPKSPYGDIPLVEPSMMPEKLKTLTAKGQQVVLRNLGDQSAYLPQDLKGDTLLLSFQGNRVGRLKALSSNFSQILGFKEGLVNNAQFVSNGETAYLLPQNGIENTETPYLIKLSTTQATDLDSYQNYLTATAAYQFEISKTYKELLDTDFYCLGKLNEKLTINKEIKAATQITEIGLDELKNPDWEDYLQEQNLRTCTAKYPIQLKPLTLPTGAKKDPLYQKWEETQTAFKAKIQEIEQQIISINEKQESVADKLKKFFAGFGIGKTTAIKKITKDLAALKQQEINIENGEKLFKEVNQIITTVVSQDQEISHKIKEAEGREKHEKQVARAKEELRELETALKEKETTLETTNAAYYDKNKDKETEQRKQQEAFVAKYFGKTENDQFIHSKEYEAKNKEIQLSITDKMEWAKIKSEISGRWGKLKKDKNFKKKKDLNKYLESLNRETGNVDNYTNSIEQEYKKKQKPLEEAIRSLKAQIPTKKEANAKYVAAENPQEKQSTISKMQGKGKNKAGQRKQGLPSLPIQMIPPEALPKVGELYQDQKNRFLRIAHWEELALAKEEAKRLKAANLCV